MKKIALVPLILLGLNACNNKPAENTTVPTQEKEPTPAVGCYAYYSGKDTVFLQVRITGNKISGNLMYHYFEKDKNDGTLQGEMKGDTLFALYTFRSEGVESSRAIAFLKKDESFIEGYGKVDAATGAPDFSDKAAIRFDDKLPLKRTDCK